MNTKNQYETETARRHENAARIRLEAVETQLSMAFTLCETAETEIRVGDRAVARKLIGQLHHHAKTISFHIDEPHHLPEVARPGLHEKMTQLEKRIEGVDSSLRPS